MMSDPDPLGDGKCFSLGLTNVPPKEMAFFLAIGRVQPALRVLPRPL